MGSLLLGLILGFISLVLFITIDLVYVLWYQRKFRQESAASDDIERSVVSSFFSSNNNNNDEPYGFGTPPPSKELALYYLYWKNETPSPFGNTNNDSTVFPPAFSVPVPPPSPPLFPIPPLPLPPPPPVVKDDAADDDDDDDEDGKLEVFRQQLRSRLSQSKRLESSPVIKADACKEEEEGGAQFSSATASPFYTTPTSSPPRPTLDGQSEVHRTVGDWSSSSLVRKQAPA